MSTPHYQRKNDGARAITSGHPGGAYDIIARREKYEPQISRDTGVALLKQTQRRRCPILREHHRFSLLRTGDPEGQRRRTRPAGTTGRGGHIGSGGFHRIVDVASKDREVLSKSVEKIRRLH